MCVCVARICTLAPEPRAVGVDLFLWGRRRRRRHHRQVLFPPNFESISIAPPGGRNGAIWQGRGATEFAVGLLLEPMRHLEPSQKADSARATAPRCLLLVGMRNKVAFLS